MFFKKSITEPIGAVHRNPGHGRHEEERPFVGEGWREDKVREKLAIEDDGLKTGLIIKFYAYSIFGVVFHEFYKLMVFGFFPL